MTLATRPSLSERIRSAGASFGVLREPNFRLYIILQLISLAGSMLQSVVQGYIVAEKTNNSAFAVGMVWAYGVLPLALLSPFAGHYIDGKDKRVVLQITSLLAFIQSCVLGHLVNTHQIAVGHLVGEIGFLALCLGIINAIDGTTRQAIIPETIENSGNSGYVKSASALFTCLYSMGQVAGPFCAGLLVLIFHNYGAIFYINAVTYIPLIIGLPFVSLFREKLDGGKSGGNDSPKKGVLEGLKEGARYTFGHRKIRTCLILSGIVCIFNFSPMALLSVASREMFGAKDISICGYLSAGFGFGGGMGAIMVFLFSKKMPFRKFVTGGAAIGGIALIGFSFSRTVMPGIACIFLAGTGAMTCFSCIRSTILHLSHLSDPGKNGAVMSFVMSFMGFGILIGFFGAGLLAKLAGCPLTFALFGVLLLSTGLGALKLHPETGTH